MADILTILKPLTADSAIESMFTLSSVEQSSMFNVLLNIVWTLELSLSREYSSMENEQILVDFFAFVEKYFCSNCLTVS